MALNGVSGLTLSHSSEDPQVDASTVASAHLKPDIMNDVDDPSGEEELTASEDIADHENVLDIAISNTQARMKSPDIPAVEKARILQSSREYLQSDAAIVDEEDEEGTHHVDSVVTSRGRTYPFPEIPSPKPGSRRPSPWKAPSSQRLRSSFSRVMMGAADGITRQRSSSSTMLDNIRKYMPDLTGLGSPSRSGSPSFPSTPRREVASQTSSSSRLRSDSQPSRMSSAGTDKAAGQVSPAEYFANTPLSLLHSSRHDAGALLSPTLTAKSRTLRRVNSDESLYIRRTSTGASKFDDTSAYADLNEMVNSRFKAITDSLQDSNLRLPKMPSINFAALRRPNLPARPSSDTACNGITRDGADSKTSASTSDHIQSAKAAVVTPAQRSHPVLADALSRTTGDIVVLGGYRGSILRSAEPPHRQLWVPIKVGLNMRKVDLEVGLTKEDEEKMEEKIIPSGTLSHIGPVDICRRLIRHLRKCPNTRHKSLRVHDYGYDWRLSPDYLADRFIKFLESLPCNQPHVPPQQRGAWIIAHSLGGLLTRYAVNKRPELFAGVVYAGVPQNCVNILGPLRNGDDVLLSSRVLTAQVNFTLRTSFALLPENGRCFLNRETGERYDVDFFDAKTWDEHRLSPCISPALPATSKEPKKSLIGSLTGSISSSLPSLPGRHSSWFPGSDSSPARSVAHETRETLESVEPSTEGALEPNMNSQSHKPSVATTSNIPRGLAFAYLERTLAEIKSFKAALVFHAPHQDSNSYPPISVMFGKSVPTVYGAKVSSREAIKYTDAYDDLAFAAGDGVVLASAAQLPEGYRCVKSGRVESDRGHVGLLGDLEGVGKCLNAVIEARTKGVGLGNKSVKT